MRCIFLGGTGSGKTVCSVKLILEQYLKSYIKPKIWSNIELKNIEYTPFTDTRQVRDMDNKDFNIVFVDEVGEMGRGFHAFSFGQLLAQSRKSVGENQLFIMTAQVKSQTNTVMRGMVDYIFFPEILTREEGSNKPHDVKLNVFVKDKFSLGSSFTMQKRPLFINVYDACECYDTYEEVNPLKDGRFLNYLSKYNKYIGTKGNIKNLTSILVANEGLNISNADRIARLIIHYEEIKDDENNL